MSTQSDAMSRVRTSERRYNVSRVIILLLAMGALIFYIGYQASHAIKEVKTDNANKLAQLEKKVDDSFNAQKRFNCSLAIQLTHSIQSVDDCVATNKLSEYPATTPVNPYQTSQTTPEVSTNKPQGSQAPAANNNPQPAPTPPPKQNIVQRTIGSIISTVKGILN